MVAPPTYDVGPARAPGAYTIALDPDLHAQLLAQAQIRGTSVETMVNLWLSERLRETEPAYRVRDASAESAGSRP